MSSLVLELQNEASTTEKSITDLLRKAYVISRKLSIEDFESWVKKELDGYDSEEELPSYRVLNGELRVKTNFGTQPLLIEDEEFHKTVTRAHVRQPAGEVSESVKVAREDEMSVMHWTSDATPTLAKMTSGRGIPVLAVPVHSFASILDAVRNTILEWSIDLESDGILGEDMRFSLDEKKKAEEAGYSTVSYNINIEHMHQSQVQQAGAGSELNMSVSQDAAESIEEFLADLKDRLDEFNLTEEQEREVDAEIQTVESQLDSPKPKSSILRSSLLTVKSVLENAAGSALGGGLVEQIPALIAALDSSGTV